MRSREVKGERQNSIRKGEYTVRDRGNKRDKSGQKSQSWCSQRLKITQCDKIGHVNKTRANQLLTSNNFLAVLVMVAGKQSLQPSNEARLE